MANEKLIFPIGFDLEEGVKEASKEWKSTYQKQLQKAIDDKPLKVKIDFESKGIDTKEFKQWMTLSREAEKLERERIKNAKEWQKVADQAAMAETRRANATNESNARIERANRNAEASEQRKRTAVERTNAAYKTQGGYLKRLFQRMVAYASVTQAFSFIRNIRDVTAEFELQRVALGSIIGDLNEANAMFEQIKAAAVKSPFQIKELVTYTKQLAAYKIESDELFETTQRLADVSAGLGVGMERLVLAYGQIRATGYLRASEVRQLTEAGIPIVEELAKKMSELRGETVSAAEVMGMISERAISFGMVKEVFDDMTSAGGMFYKMQETQAETLAGQWSNLQDSIAIMYEEIGNTEGVNNAMKGMIGLIKSLAENWRTVGDVAVWSVGAAMGYAKVIKPISELIQKHRLLNKAKEAEIIAEKNLARVRQLNAEKAEYLAQDEWVNDAWLEATNDQIKAHQEYADKHTKIASEARKSATALKGFGGALKSIGSFIKANWVGMLITAVTAFVSWLISARQEANRLNKELAKIGTEGALQIDQQVRNFEYLAKVIRESADGSEKQTKALAEMKRSYGDLLPTQDKEIQALIQEKSNYDALIAAIREKINLQMHEQKLNAIAGEYGGRISKQESKLQKTLSEIGLSPAEIGRIFETVKQKVQEGATLGIEDFAKILTDKTTLAFERVGDTSVVSAGLFKGVDVRDFEKYVETLGEYNEQIELVGGSLDHLDDKGKNLSDTFNTWQKELASITEGKNLKGEGIRLFDDESITQISKLTDATARVADEYDKLAKEKKEVDKALKSEGAKADKDTYAKLQERLGKINEGMSGLYDFLKKYGALDLIKSDDKGQKYAYQALKDELVAVEKIYKRYQDLRKLKSETDTQSILANEFKGVSLTTLSKAYSPEQMIEVYQKALAEAQRLGKKDLVLEIQTKIGEFNVAEEQRKLEKNLKKLSDDLSRTKTAKEFFDRMLGLTGDKQLSATLTLSVYGTTGDDLKSALVKQVQGAFAGQDLSKAINTDLNSIDLSALREIYNNLPEDFQEKQKQSMKQVLDMLEKGHHDLANNFAKLLMDYDEMEQKRVTITQKATQEIATLEQGLQAQIEGIHQNKEITDKDSAIADATARAEAVRKAILAREKLELSKLSPEYIRFFSSINAMAMETANSTRTQLRRALFDAFEQGGISAEELRKELKAIDTQFNKLNENATLFSSYATGGFDAWLQKLQQSADELDAIAARMMKLESIDQMDEGDKDFVNKMLRVFGDKGQKSLSNLATSFNGDMLQMGDAVQKVGGQMQGMFSSATGAILIVDAIIKGVGQTIDGVGQVIDQINSMRSEDNQIGGWFKYIQDFNKYAQAGWEDLKSGNIAGALANTVSSIISIFQNIQADKIKKLNEDIERQQELLDQLAYSYEQLEKAQEKAFSTDYISNYEQRLANLQAQQEAYLKQADAERSKGKKADSDKIKEYEEQARDTADAIKDMQSELSEYFLGTDLTSAARDFANAWIDAYKEFGNTTDAMKEKFQDMIQNMIVESFAAKVIQSALSDVFTEIDNMTKDGVFDISEASKIADMTEVAVGNIDVGMTNLMNALSQAGISVRGMGSDLTGISRDIATASEESILGLAAGINTQNFYISQVPTKLDTIIGLLRGENAMQGSTITLQDLVTLQNQHLSYLPSIAQHTAETVAECKRTADACVVMVDKLNSVIKPRGTQATHTLNTTIGS